MGWDDARKGENVCGTEVGQKPWLSRSQRVTRVRHLRADASLKGHRSSLCADPRGGGGSVTQRRCTSAGSESRHRRFPSSRPRNPLPSTAVCVHEGRFWLACCLLGRRTNDRARLLGLSRGGGESGAGLRPGSSPEAIRATASVIPVHPSPSGSLVLADHGSSGAGDPALPRALHPRPAPCAGRCARFQRRRLDRHLHASDRRAGVREGPAWIGHAETKDCACFHPGCAEEGSLAVRNGVFVVVQSGRRIVVKTPTVTLLGLRVFLDVFGYDRRSDNRPSMWKRVFVPFRPPRTR